MSSVNNSKEDEQYKQIKKESAVELIKASAAMQLANDTTKMLENFTPSLGNKNTNSSEILSTYKETYKTKCKETPHLKNFAKAVGAVIISGIGLVIGFAIGAICGGLVGILMCEPTIAILGGILGGYTGGTCGAYGGYKLAKKANEIPDGAFKHFLTFRTPLYSAAKKAAEAGEEMFEKKNKITMK